jgi:glycine betaine/proline transport system substrate-binding protein
MFTKKFLTKMVIGVLSLTLILSFTGCTSDSDDDGNGNGGNGGEEPKPTLIFGDLNWDSAQFHNRVAAFIVENGYGYPVDYIAGATIPIWLGLSMGDIDINMELWLENQQEAYDESIAAGTVIDLGENFWDNWQGWLVPRYVVEGDPERGIEPMAPGLSSVTDLPQYWEVFVDPEDPDKGIFYSCIPGWACEIINETKMEAYGLTEYYNILPPGSGAALLSSLAGAYLQGEPWFGYYWEPTSALGMFDMIRLEEPAFDEEIWGTTNACAYPAVHVNICVNSGMIDKAPDVVEFLEAYTTTTPQINAALAYMEENEASADEAAIWFLEEYEDVWTQWVSDGVAAQVKAALS